jgi:hypothetical protein
MCRVAVGLLAVILFIGALSGPAVADLPPGGTFFDDDGSVHEGAIEAIAAAGLTVGCDRSGEWFCPDRAVTRAEMATFLVRALGVERREPVRFTDVVGVHRGSIGAAEAEGWFKGCNPPVNNMFCPDDALTRGQAAAVLVRAFGLPAGDAEFSDVEDSIFASAAGGLAVAGVTKGCDPPANDHFCPDRPLTRGEMATFLARLLGLTPQTPDPAFEGRIVLGRLGGHLNDGGLAAMEGARITRSLPTFSSGLPLLSPDGSTIAYEDEARVCPTPMSTWYECYRRIFTMPFGGGPESQITPDALRFAGFDWLPDGGSIGFAATWDAEIPAPDQFVGVVDLASPLEVEVLADPAGHSYLSANWSPAGEIVSTVTSASGYRALVILSAEGVEQSVLSAAGADVTAATWSPDGSLLAFIIQRDTLDEVVVSSPDGTRRTVAATGTELQVAGWSPDGSRLLIRRDSEEYPLSELVVCAIDGGGCHSLVSTETLFGAVWSPDGSAVAYVDDHRAWVVAATGGEPWPLTPSDFWVASIDWGVAP